MFSLVQLFPFCFLANSSSFIQHSSVLTHLITCGCFNSQHFDITIWTETIISFSIPFPSFMLFHAGPQHLQKSTIPPARRRPIDAAVTSGYAVRLLFLPMNQLYPVLSCSLYFPPVSTVMTFPGGTTFTPVNSCCLPLLIRGSWASIRPLMNKIASYCALPHCNLMSTHSNCSCFNWAHPLLLEAFTRIEAPHLCGRLSRRLVCHGCFMP